VFAICIQKLPYGWLHGSKTTKMQHGILFERDFIKKFISGLWECLRLQKKKKRSKRTRGDDEI